MLGLSYSDSHINYKNGFEILSPDYRDELKKIKKIKMESDGNEVPQELHLDYPILRFRAVIQTLDEENNNGITYPLNKMVSPIQELNKLVEWGGLTGEYDHPEFSVSDDNLILKRVSQIQIQRSCVWYEKIWLDESSKTIQCIAQTMSSFFGNEFRNNLIQKIKIGFSMRGLCENEDINGKYFATEPIKIVTYDVVTKPSHRPAVVSKIFTESTVEKLGNFRPAYSFESQCDLIENIRQSQISAHVEENIRTKYKII